MLLRGLCVLGVIVWLATVFVISFETNKIAVLIAKILMWAVPIVWILFLILISFYN